MFAKNKLSVVSSVLLACALCCFVGAGVLSVPDHAWAASSSPTISITRAATGKLVIKKGASYKLGAKASAGKLSYQSSKKTIVKVSAKGVLKALKPGKATITVKAKNGAAAASKKVKVTVVKAAKYTKATKLKVTPLKAAMKVGETVKLKTTFTPSKASNKNLLFKSSKPSVANVSDTGVVTAVAAGNAKITVTSCDNAKTKASVTVFVASGGQGSEDAVAVQAELSEYTWDQLKAIANEISASGSKSDAVALAQKYNLANSDGKLEGDLKELELADGVVCHVRILGFWHDDKSDGGKAGITFEFADIPECSTINSTPTNSHGWYQSGVRSWLNGSFFDLLPEDVQAAIAPVDKKTNNVGQTYVPGTEHHNSGDTGCVTKTFNEKLWLLGMTEVYGKLSKQSTSIWSTSTYDAEGTQYQLYANQGASFADCSFCVKHDAVEGTAMNWWLRTPNAMNSTDWYGVDEEGNAFTDGASVSYGVSPCFCF